MDYPAFYDRVAPIRLRDPLADFLGALKGGVVEVRYLDAVRLAGHSCPTVAGAFLMATRGLEALYGDDLPTRGEIEVRMRQPIEEGVCGVVANVLSLITGAAADGGFHGIGDRFDRRRLLSFGNASAAPVRFTRRDTGKSASVRYDPGVVPPDPEMMPLLQRQLAGLATEEEAGRFRRLWQGRVEAILCDHADDPRLITVDVA